jgi:Fe-S-cluster containining protein
MADYDTIAVGAARAALSVMRDVEKSPPLIDRVVDTAHELAHAVNDKLQRDGDPQRRYLPVCRTGCAFCCHTDVVVGVPEVLRIARHLTETRSPEELAELRARLGAASERTREMSAKEWKAAKIPCRLLDEVAGSCTIHEVRPAACRAHNSMNVEDWEAQYETGDAGIRITCNDVQRHAILAVGVGLAAACRAPGLEWEVIGLAAGLAHVLGAPDAAARWLAGERPLEAARTKTSRALAPYQRTDVDHTMRRLEAHTAELPPRAPQRASDDDARRERNRRKREKKRW